MATKQALLQQKFQKRFLSILDKRGLRAEDLLRLSKTLRFAAINRWRYGTRMPSPNSAAALCRALDITPGELLSGVGVTSRYMADVKALLEAA